MKRRKLPESLKPEALLHRLCFHAGIADLGEASWVIAPGARLVVYGVLLFWLWASEPEPYTLTRFWCSMCEATTMLHVSNALVEGVGVFRHGDSGYDLVCGAVGPTSKTRRTAFRLPKADSELRQCLVTISMHLRGR